jgi:acetyltransferase-like isoleucine patch superfamily enzyme
MQETIVDPRKTTPEEHAEGVRQAQVLFKLNHTMPYTDEYNALLRELFGVNLGEGSRVMPGLTGVCFDRVKIGNGVMIMNNCLMMSRGGITIDPFVNGGAGAKYKALAAKRFENWSGVRD